MRLIEHNVDIIALWELAISDFNVTIASKDWRVIYPTTHTKNFNKTRSVIMIQTNLLTNSWLQLDIEMGDITIVKLKGTWGMLTVFNIYNNCDHNNTIKLVSKF